MAETVVHRRTLLLALLLVGGPLAPGAAQTRAPGPHGPEQGRAREQPWLIPTDDGSGRLMRSVVYRPPGDGPWRLAVINHGAPLTNPANAGFIRFQRPAAWLVERGFTVVVPQRRGYGETGGRFDESWGDCDQPDYVGAASEAARDVAAAVAYMRQQPFVRAERGIVVGQSAGGWATIGYASTNPPGIAAMINFAGGRGARRNNLPNNNCAPDRLVEAAGMLGSTARVPMLWLYTENDSYFDTPLSRRLHAAFVGAGGIADYVQLPPFGDDGHALFRVDAGLPVWAPHVEQFLHRFP
jgi:dienelactone hydrolase